MDQRGKLNKSERENIEERLKNYIMDDKNIDLIKYISDANQELTNNIQKKFDELIGYKGEIKEFAEKFNLNWGTTYYLSDFKQNCCCGEDVEPKFPEKYREFEPCLAHIRISYCFYINTHFSGLRDKVTRKEFLPLFIAWHDKHFDEINNRIKLFNKIYNEVMMVFNTLKKANDVLDKFGFIKSINLYINDLLSQNVHPISCVTEDVEKSVDNYLSQRKTLDDTEN